MPELTLFDCAVVAWILIAGLTFVALRYRRAAYGRYADQSKGPMVSARLGWIAMESVSALAFAAFFFAGDRMQQLPALLFFCMWEAHYIHRSWIYPLRANPGGRKMALSIVVLGIVFNTANASLNGYWLFHRGPELPAAWLVDPRFLVGLALFLGGMAINISSDYRLLALRRDSTDRYSVPPDRGLFRWVSCPNYFGEILQWCAWALATWSLVGLSFAAWTVGNLAPRALAHHRWYRETFPDYPARRKALIPFLV